MAKIKELFPEFHQEDLSENDLELSKKNLIVIDTNYLLDILRLPIEQSEQYITALEKMKNNIYIPYLVALEFHFNKIGVKKGIQQEINNYRTNFKNKYINDFVDNITNVSKITFLDIKKDEFNKEINNSIEEMSNKLMNIFDHFIEDYSSIDNEGLYKRLLTIIERCIGEKYTQSWINKVEEYGEIRYAEKKAPGFNDAEKTDFKEYSGIKYQEKYGDLIIWEDVKEYAKNEEISGDKVIFVTNDGQSDNKKDLYYSVSGMTVGPRINLMDELTQTANKKLYIIKNQSFVKYVNNLSAAEYEKFDKASDKLYKMKFKNDSIKDPIEALHELYLKNPDKIFEIDENRQFFVLDADELDLENIDPNLYKTITSIAKMTANKIRRLRARRKKMLEEKKIFHETEYDDNYSDYKYSRLFSKYQKKLAQIEEEIDENIRLYSRLRGFISDY